MAEPAEAESPGGCSEAPPRTPRGEEPARSGELDLAGALQEIEAQGAELARLREAVAAYRRAEGRMAKLAQQLQRELAERDVRIQELEAQLRQEQASASRVQVVPIERISDLEAAARNLQAAVRAREARLGELEALADAQAVHIAELEQQDARAVLVGKEAEVAMLKEVMAAQAARISQLEAQPSEPPASGPAAALPAAAAAAAAAVAAAAALQLEAVDERSDASSATCLRGGTPDQQADDSPGPCRAGAFAAGGTGGAPTAESDFEDSACHSLACTVATLADVQALQDFAAIEAYAAPASTKEASMAAIAAAVAGVLGGAMGGPAEKLAAAAAPGAAKRGGQAASPCVSGSNGPDERDLQAIMSMGSMSQGVSTITDPGGGQSRTSSPSSNAPKAASQPGTPPAAAQMAVSEECGGCRGGRQYSGPEGGPGVAPGAGPAGGSARGLSNGTSGGSPVHPIRLSGLAGALASNPSHQAPTAGTLTTPRLSTVGSSMSASPVLSARETLLPGDRPYTFSTGSVHPASSSSGQCLAGSVSGSSMRGTCSPLSGHGRRAAQLGLAACAGGGRSRLEASAARARQQPAQQGAAAGPHPAAAAATAAAAAGLAPPQAGHQAARGANALASPRFPAAPLASDLRLRSASPPAHAEQPPLRSLSPLPGAQSAVRVAMPGCSAGGPPSRATFAGSPRLQVASPPRGSPAPQALREARSSAPRRSAPRGAWMHS